MTITDEEKKKVLKSIIKHLSSSSECTRNEVINGALVCYGFSKQEIEKAQGATAKVNYIRSYIGTALTNLISQGDVKVDERKRYSLAKEQLVIVKEEECRTEIFRLLKTKSMKKADVYLALQKKFGTDKTTSTEDDNSLKQIAGQILSEEKKNGVLREDNGSFSLTVKKQATTYPSTSLPEEQFAPLFISRINELGGEFFERFVANMLEKYYLINGRDVLSCDIVGGSNDGGVDVIMETEEELGFVERIIIQTKNRKNIQTTEKEIREFYGVMNAQKGTRGIFVTTSSFHPAAEKLLLSLPNCVGIDGKKLFSLVKQTVYGIHKTKSGFSFDNAIFIR